MAEEAQPPRPLGRPSVRHRGKSRPYQVRQQDIIQPIAPPVDADERDEEWSAMNWKKSLKELCDPNPEVVKRRLRRIHLRWYHASAPAMTRLLEMIGCPDSAIHMVRDVVATCRVCRTWTRKALDTKIVFSIEHTLQSVRTSGSDVLRVRCDAVGGQCIFISSTTIQPHSVAHR